EQKEPGYHSVTWDASDVASGIYFYKLQAGEFTQTKRMTLLK
ncbi:MAG: T9SS type A sorting domain-containing protein, partial [candidate division Zixibacteria bacterium]|nr:T9SS type A sorting domain-containing protein [candidate division Zixibacteria bacterium]